MGVFLLFCSMQKKEKPSNIPPEKHRLYYGLNYNANLTDNLRCYGYVEREQGHGYTKEIEAGIWVKYTF